MAAFLKASFSTSFLPHPARSAGRRATSSLSTLKEVLRAELDGIRAAGTWKNERVITTPQAASIRVQGRSGELLNFCANNYLGLSVSLERCMYGGRGKQEGVAH